MPIDEGRIVVLENTLRYCHTMVDSVQDDCNTLTEVVKNCSSRVSALESACDEVTNHAYIRYFVKESLKEILQDAIKELNRTPSEITLEEFEAVLNDHTYFEF